MMFYKRSCLSLWTIVFLLFAFSSVGICDYPTLQNPSFENGTTSWKAVNSNYVGIQDGGQWYEPYAVSEISPDGGPTDGDQYVLWYDNGLYQITKDTIGEDEVYHVSVDAVQSWDAVICKVDLGYETGPNSYETAVSETFYPSRRMEYISETDRWLYVGTWERFTLEYIPEATAVGKPFYIKIGNEDVGEWLAIDNVQLGCYKKYTSLVYPPDGGKNIPVDAVLQWNLDEGFICDVYFGTHPDPNYWMNDMVIEDEVITSYDPYGPTSPAGDLEYGTTYYWQVNPDPNGFISYQGKWWSFTTVTKTPVVIDGPYSQTADVVTLTVEAEGLRPFISYNWYKVSEPDDILYDTTTEPSLSIDVGSDISLEGYYYCTVTNAHGTSEPSPTARVMQPRLVGWWKFDGDSTDSVAEVVLGAPTHDGTDDPDGYVDGVTEESGQAAKFTGGGTTVTISDSIDYFNFYPQGMTVSTWVSCNLNGTWDGIVGKQSNKGGAGRSDFWVAGWNLSINDYGGEDPKGTYFQVRNPYRDMIGDPDDGDINDDQWHLITGVIEPNYLDRTCLMHLYVDGALRDTSARVYMDSILQIQKDLLIGRIRTLEELDLTGAFHGKVDDVKIYNYALEEYDIATMYLDWIEGVVCVEQNKPWREFDVVGEPGGSSWCRVDIADFAEFASAWMNCNLLRDCLQIY